jgi:hypothetical protein
MCQESLGKPGSGRLCQLHCQLRFHLSATEARIKPTNLRGTPREMDAIYL